MEDCDAGGAPHPEDGRRDVFNTIGGSNGFMGCADETIAFKLRARGSSGATRSITGRDVKDQELSVKFTNCHWALVEKVSDEDLEEKRRCPKSGVCGGQLMLDRSPASGRGRRDRAAFANRVRGVRVNVLSKYLNECLAYLRFLKGHVQQDGQGHEDEPPREGDDGATV